MKTLPFKLLAIRLFLRIVWGKDQTGKRISISRNCDSGIWGLHDLEVIGDIYRNPELIKQ